MNTTSTNLTTRHAKWITPLFYGLVFYTLGGSMMDSFAMYHTWLFVGKEEFIKMHMESGGRIVQVFVLPSMLMTIFLVLQFWHRHKTTTRAMLWICVACVTTAWLSSAFIQIPMQIKLDEGYNEELLHKLITTDWIRVIPSFVEAGVVYAMMVRAWRPVH